VERRYEVFVETRAPLLIDEDDCDHHHEGQLLWPGLMHLGSVATSFRISMSEYYKTKLNKWYNNRSYTRLSIESSSGLAFDEGLSILSKMTSEGPTSTLPLPDLDIGCDLVDSE